MRGTGRPGRGERGQVAARVRALLAEPDQSPPGSAAPAAGAGPEAWVPGRWDEPADPGGPGDPGDPAVSVRSRLRSAGRSAGLRWEPDRRAVAAVGVAVLIAGLVTAWWVLSSRPRDLAVHASAATGRPSAVAATPAVTAPGAAPAGTATSGSGPGASARASPEPRLVVDVAGKVRHPGVYRLPAGARVVDAVRAAGGARKGVSTASLNLAAPLHDGEQVVVGRPRGAPPAGSGPGSGSGSGSAGPVNLNTATLAQLETLPGIGPVLAQRILDWRSEHGRFGSVEQLDEVSGIGTVTFAQLRNRVVV